MRKFLCLMLGILSTFTYAYEMHGTLNDNNDGTFQVNVISTNGHEYMGFADMQGDGTLTVNIAIQGGGSEIYLGTAKLNMDGNYDLFLRNNTTGEVATGTLERSS